MKNPKPRPTPDVIGSAERPVYDKVSVAKNILDLMPQSELLTQLRRDFEEGEVMLEEKHENQTLYVILQGFVSQVKEGEDIDAKIGMQGPGDFIGLLSFQSGEPVFTTARATTKVVTLALNHANIDVFLEQYPNISKALQGLIFSNLAQRYRSVVNLHVEVATLSRELELERNQLRKTIRELERTRNALISQEKMATLGELTAGLAHEINNPASALLRSVEYLAVNLPQMAEKASALPDTGLVRFCFEAGMKRIFADTQEQRARMKQMAQVYPHIARTSLRIMAEMDEGVLQKISPFAGNPGKADLLQLLLDAYQSGVFLNNIRLSTSRIEFLVKSLKSYSRQGGKEPERIEVREGIRETLLILGNRLKDIKLNTQLEEVPPVLGFPGELNQVWTNIIINACDAMNDRGELYISTRHNKIENTVVITLADNGPGVPDKIKKRIFDSSFTTKTAGGDFGLGVGLAISEGVIEKHHGTIHVQDRQGGGAEFVIVLPAIE
ncbi:MAG: ATP-binding protein [Bacteroidales bacterium]